MGSRAIRALRWLLPLAVVLAAELAARRAFDDVPHGWYDEVPAGESWTGDLVCIGSSLTAHAIHVAPFEEQARESGVDVRVHNFGMGATTIALHELALRALARREPGILRGARFLMETPGALPHHGRTAELDRHADFLTPSNRAQQLFVATVGRQEVTLLWGTGLSLENKLSYSVRWATKWLALSRERERCRAAVLDAWNSAVGAAVRSLERSATPAQKQARPLALADAGGMRVDEDVMTRAREMIDAFRQERGDEFPAWEESTFASLVAFLRAEGAEVAVYDPPLHHTYREVLERPETSAARAAFARYLEAQRIPMLRPDFVADDRLFPDFIHLSRLRAPDFTRALAREWLRL